MECAPRIGESMTGVVCVWMSALLLAKTAAKHCMQVEIVAAVVESMDVLKAK